MVLIVVNIIVISSEVGLEPIESLIVIVDFRSATLLLLLSLFLNKTSFRIIISNYIIVNQLHFLDFFLILIDEIENRFHTGLTTMNLANILIKLINNLMQHDLVLVIFTPLVEFVDNIM